MSADFCGCDGVQCCPRCTTGGLGKWAPQLATCSYRDRAASSVYVISGPGGFTETLSAGVVDTLVRLGLIEHERDGHLMTNGRGDGVGPLHHFYREARA